MAHHEAARIGPRGELVVAAGRDLHLVLVEAVPQVARDHAVQQRLALRVGDPERRVRQLVDVALGDRVALAVHFLRLRHEPAPDLRQYRQRPAERDTRTERGKAAEHTAAVGIGGKVVGAIGGVGHDFTGMGKSRARVYVQQETGITFDDIAGIDEAKAELQQLVAFLRNPDRYQRLGGKIPKGVLVVGAPGTGKTLLARAVAGEAAVPFFSISGSAFVEMFVGVGAARVRDLFEQAQQKAPCIVFVDELDALGKVRGVGPMSGNDEREQTLNQLLVEMDGFQAGSGVIIMAATNRPEILDPALLRPGRFDRHIAIDRPDVNGRRQILGVHVKRVKLAAEVDLGELASRTPGFVGADLANVVNEAALHAAELGKPAIGMADFDEAIDRALTGLERKSRVMNAQEKLTIAYHEAGHALVAESRAHCDPVKKVSIIPRGVAALGYTQQVPTEDRYVLRRSELLDRIDALLGGRVAEELVFGDVSTGAQNDLERATAMARHMVMQYGMSDKIGLATFDDGDARQGMPGAWHAGAGRCSEHTARMIDDEHARGHPDLGRPVRCERRGARIRGDGWLSAVSARWPPRLRPLRQAHRENACATSARRSCVRSPSARSDAGGVRRAAS
ncbi:hypothetical protein MKW94_009196 [Papaver nudicaule]|uniref:AAA+ ATPase domain-containing protein n=1 Tax=Papaver nudicaule TaxID=74823 RepID=A0AA41V7I2_PAPNU|nr:hypothetical protein [Papaver nudicaule]